MTEKPTELLVKAKIQADVRKYFLIAFIPSLIYAVVRYNILKEVPWSQTPLWVTNKAFAMAATILIGLSFSMSSVKPRKEIGLLGASIAMIHVIMSLALLNPAYYAKFFLPDGRYSLSGELIILSGIASAAFLAWASYQSFPALLESSTVRLKLIHKLVLLALVFNLFHLVLMGATGWINISGWGLLPPVSLISALLCLFFICKRQFRKKA